MQSFEKFSMQKKFISNLALMMALNLLIKPVAIFGIDAAIQNRVGVEDYGMYFSLLNFSFLFTIILDFGINNFTTKNVAQYPEIALKYLGKILIFRLVLFIFYAVISLTIAYFLNWNWKELYLLSILLFNQLLMTLIAYIRSHFSGLLLFKVEAILSVLDRLILIIIGGILLYLPFTNSPFQIEWFIWIQTISYGITLLIGFILLFSKIGMPRLKYRPIFSYAIIRKSFPYALLILLMMIYTRMDSVMIERMLPDGKAQAGFYAHGFRLISAFFMFAMIFSNLLFPIFSHMFSKSINVKPLLLTSSRILIGGSILIAIVCFFNSQLILDLIYDNAGTISNNSFKILVFSFIGMCSSIIFGTVLTAKGSLKFLNVTAFVGIIINFLLNYFLIEIYGAIGAAIATLATQSTVSLIQFIYCITKLKLEFSFIVFGQFTMFISSVFLLAFFVKAESFPVLLLILLLSLLSMFIFRLIDIKKLRIILKGSNEEDIPY